MSHYTVHKDIERIEVSDSPTGRVVESVIDERTTVRDGVLIVLNSGLGFYRHRQLSVMSIWHVIHGIANVLSIDITDLDGLGMDANWQHGSGYTDLEFYADGQLDPTQGYATFIGEIDP